MDVDRKESSEFYLRNVTQVYRFFHAAALAVCLPVVLLLTGCGSAGHAVSVGEPTVAITSSPASIGFGGSSILSVTAANVSQVTVTGTDGSSYTLSATGGTQAVTPTATTTYTATATGTGGKVSAAATVTVAALTAPTVTITANPTSITSGGSSTLSVTASNATQVTVTGTDGSSYTLSATGGTQAVTPTATTTYTATATGTGGKVSVTATVTVAPPGSLQSVQHVVFLLQENHTFDNYFGMLNPYRHANNMEKGDDGKAYSVDGIDNKLATISNQNDEGTTFPLFKLKSTCIDDVTSSWLESYGDVSRYDFTLNRSMEMDGFVHTAENFAKFCAASNGARCSGKFTETTGQRAMGYYDEKFLNYYYYMASQFAVSDRWFSPFSSKSVPNRIATLTGGTTQGLVFDPGNDDRLPQLAIKTIFRELTEANVSWKIYYTVTNDGCIPFDKSCPSNKSQYPAAIFSDLQDSYQYLYIPAVGAACSATTQPSGVVGDKNNSFCIDTTHIAPLAQYYTDLTNNALPSFAFIEAGYGVNDEHPGSGQSILSGQTQVAQVVSKLMTSSSWKNSIFFLSFDEGGGPYDHVPPVPGHSNEKTDAMVGDAPLSTFPDISTIAVNPDGYNPCLRPSGGAPTTNCDLTTVDPGANANDAAAQKGFAAQLGFRLPNIVISPFTRKHYVSHIPMDHTAVIKFVENRFIGPNAHLTNHDAAQPNLLDFFDFSAVPWSAPPMTIPTPLTPADLGFDPCTPTSIGP